MSYFYILISILAVLYVFHSIYYMHATLKNTKEQTETIVEVNVLTKRLAETQSEMHALHNKYQEACEIIKELNQDNEILTKTVEEFRKIGVAPKEDAPKKSQNKPRRRKPTKHENEKSEN